VRALAALLAAATPAAAATVEGCGAPPDVTSLVEPWEETSVSLGDGAIRLALLHGNREEGVSLLVLTLPPLGEGPEPAEGAPPVERTCRVVGEGGTGFAVIDVGGVEATEDPEAATLTARLPALRFVPESTELEEVTLTLTFGVADDSLVAVTEGGEDPAGP
jgi:hypothetical protein